MGPSVLWFRHGLRLHDNPALLHALQLAEGGQFMAVFIFDGESAGTKLVGYNRMKFLLEALADLDCQLRSVGGQLFVFRGTPTFVFRRLWEELRISSISFEQDCEPIWQDRDNAVKVLCRDLAIGYHERISHTLWNPREVIATNGGIAPLTYQMFLHTVNCLGPPPRPVPDPDFLGVSFVKLRSCIQEELGLGATCKVPVPEDFGLTGRSNVNVAHVNWKGGEIQALENLMQRLKIETDAFIRGDYLPNQMRPDLLGAPTSLSAHLRFGCLSVRRFYYAIHDRFAEVQSSTTAFGQYLIGGPHITGQLIFREFFYIMSVDNRYYDRMESNPICLNIPWYTPEAEKLAKWENGHTGFPLIDAGMRQLSAEGWLHHTLRNAVATFLTRGGLWYSWEVGLQFFLKNLLDADWSVCAGNWMWISSSAFEKLLDSSRCTCPVALGRRLDPKGEYIMKYIPELRNLPQRYIHEPWTAPQDIQEASGCIIGKDYPHPMIDLKMAGNRNAKAMQEIRQNVLRRGDGKPSSTSEGLPVHCRPSSNEEIRQFFWLNDDDNQDAI